MGRDVLFIGGVFAEENIDEIVEKSIGTIEYSANIFQERLISGFKKNNISITVVSAPFIGAYPMRSKQVFFENFKNTQDKYEYVPFCNIWGVRNFSRANSVKRKIKSFIDKNDESEKLIVVYSAHEPFLEAAAWAKKKNSNIKICFVVPDLPQYMNLNSNRSLFYDFFKKIDIIRMNKYMKEVDSFVLLTEDMKEVLKVGNRPYMVVEGIIEDDFESNNEIVKNDLDIKYIVYTGKLNEKFGVKDLIHDFHLSDHKNYRLILVGEGDCVSYINEVCCQDSRIIYKGQVTPEEAKKWQNKADVLVNPRKNDGEYTKYSFPSKTIEYLKTGRPVVAYMLDGMKDMYREFIYTIPHETNYTIMNIVQDAVEDNCSREKYERFLDYLEKNLRAKKIVKSIIEM